MRLSRKRVCGTSLSANYLDRLSPFAMGLLAAACLAALIVLNRPALGSEMIRMVGNTLSGEQAEHSLDEIDALGVAEFDVFNPYEEQLVRYSGVLLDRLITHFGHPSVQQVKVTALDDYRTIFTRSEWEKNRILFVTRVRGERIGYDRKGPARIVYPDFDPDRAEHKINLPKWMWLIQEIEFK